MFKGTFDIMDSKSKIVSYNTYQCSVIKIAKEFSYGCPLHYYFNYPCLIYFILVIHAYHLNNHVAHFTFVLKKP